MTAIRRLVRTVLRRLRAEDGAVTADFVFAFPPIMLILLASIEAGMMMTRGVMLERALDLTVRDLRLGITENPTHDQIRADVCARLAILLPNCTDVLLLELRPVSTATWNVFDAGPVCVDRTAQVQPLTTFVPGESNELMLVRACVVFDPYFPTTGFAANMNLDASGGYALVAMSAFVNEPR
jgi:Flp pilus assembly protein TadG